MKFSWEKKYFKFPKDCRFSKIGLKSFASCHRFKFTSVKTCWQNISLGTSLASILMSMYFRNLAKYTKTWHFWRFDNKSCWFSNFWKNISKVFSSKSLSKSSFIKVMLSLMFNSSILFFKVKTSFYVNSWSMGAIVLTILFI